MKIVSDFSDANLDQMLEVYHSVGWEKHTIEVIREIFESSNVIALVIINGRVVGFGRALSDGVFNAAIYDVVVHKDFQNQGIAKSIMENLLERLRNVSCVHLISTTGNEDFYKKLGLKRLKTGMGRYLNPNLSDVYLIEE